MHINFRFLLFVIIAQLAFILSASEQTNQQVKQESSQNLLKNYKGSIISAIATTTSYFAFTGLNKFNNKIQTKISEHMKTERKLDWEYDIKLPRFSAPSETLKKELSYIKELINKNIAEKNRLLRHSNSIVKFDTILRRGAKAGVIITPIVLGYEGYKHYQSKK